MSLDLPALIAAIARHGRVARVVVAGVQGSTPREAGAAMLVWAGGQQGTIGGGALEHGAAARARAMLAEGGAVLDRLPLGPALGQCCGGAVSLLTEVFAADAGPVLDATSHSGLFARPLPPGTAKEMPLPVRRLLVRLRDRGNAPAPQMLAGWMIEPLTRPRRHLWIWGAGHVGRALVATIAPLPDFGISWVDTAPARFPDVMAHGIVRRVAEDPAELVADAPQDAEHLIVTYSHALDLELCHRLLGHGFSAAGLIGSASKWARFRSRLAALGHAPEAILQIACPIGDPALGKHPQAIAIGVAAALLAAPATRAAATPPLDRTTRTG